MGFLPKDYERPSTGNDRYFRFDEDFGNPNHYDLKVQRMGTGMDTKYFINALPPTEFSKEVQSVIDTELIHIKMKELFKGGDPFDGIPF
jgi:hypothetical protein